MRVTRYGRPDATRRLLALVGLMVLLSEWHIYYSACPRPGSDVQFSNVVRFGKLQHLRNVVRMEKDQQATENEPTLGTKDEVS